MDKPSRTRHLNRKGAKDKGPRVTTSLKSAMQLFLDEKGELVTEALERGLQSLDGKVSVLDGHNKGTTTHTGAI